MSKQSGNVSQEIASDDRGIKLSQHLYSAGLATGDVPHRGNILLIELMDLIEVDYEGKHVNQVSIM